MRWHKSLYWRIAIGFVLFLATMLVVQAMLFVWVVARSGRTVPGQSPGRFSETVALDLANALGREPDLDVARYVREQYGQNAHPFFVMLVDGRLVTSGSSSFPEPLLRMARARLQRRFERPEGGAFGRSPRPGPGPRGGDGDPNGPRFEPDGPGGGARRDRAPFGRGPRGEGPDGDPGYRFVRPTPIVVDGRLAGVVVVPPDAPFSVVLGRFAPMLAAIAASVLILGTIAASALIFGPARRRLRQLEGAARRFGTGDLSARAPDRGGDEIAAVAGAFNTMADDLSARAEALAASDKARRQLLADVSHELTTPVTAMRGYLETLTMPELALDQTTKTRYLHIIADETARLERIIGDLLDLAKLEGGGGTFTVEDVPVSQLFGRVAARHERAAATRRVAMVQVIAPGAEMVRGDRDRLEQALQNLAGNALRYAPPGSTLTLTAQPQDGGVTISVEDQGPGIAAEHLPHIFDRFYKVESSRALDRSGDHVEPPRSTPGNVASVIPVNSMVVDSSDRSDERTDGQKEAAANGSGLGLSIVKAIVERHGGRISVDSRPGRTVFQFTMHNSQFTKS
jgi:signal transduction histidine kinase